MLLGYSGSTSSTYIYKSPTETNSGVKRKQRSLGSRNTGQHGNKAQVEQQNQPRSTQQENTARATKHQHGHNLSSNLRDRDRESERGRAIGGASALLDSPWKQRAARA